MPITYYGCRDKNAIPGDNVYIWFPGTNPYNVWGPILPAGWSLFAPGKLTEGGWDWQWAWGIRVPSNAAPGVYEIQVDATTVETVPITVVAAPAAKPTHFVTPTTVGLNQEIRDKVLAGFEVVFTPGLYKIPNAIVTDIDAHLSGYGAVLRRMPDGDIGERMFFPQAGLTLEGLTFEFDKSIPVPTASGSAERWIIHKFPRDLTDTAPHVTVRDCTIKKGATLLKSTERNMVVEDCRFLQGMSGEISFGSVWINTEFIGHAREGAVWYCIDTGGKGALIADCKWTLTSRGMVFQNGAVVGVVGIGLYFERIRGGTHGGGEVILLERPANDPTPPSGTNGMYQNAFIRVYCNDCSGPGLYFDGGGIHDNLCVNCDMETDNRGILCAVGALGAQNNNTFRNIECLSMPTFWGPVGVVNLDDVQVLQKVLRRGSYTGTAGTYYVVMQESGLDIDASALANGTFNITNCNLWRSDRIQIPITNKNFHMRNLLQLPAGPYNP